VNLVCVSPDKVAQVWPLVGKHVDNALSRSGWSDLIQVCTDLVDGNALLWVAVEGDKVEGAGVTKLIEEQGRRICEIVAWGADDQHKCHPLLETIHRYANAEHCVAVRLVGRKGWARSLPEYKIKALIMEKALM